MNLKYRPYGVKGLKPQTSRKHQLTIIVTDRINLATENEDVTD